jgi:hypothetical protein
VWGGLTLRDVEVCPWEAIWCHEVCGHINSMLSRISYLGNCLTEGMLKLTDSRTLPRARSSASKASFFTCSSGSVSPAVRIPPPFDVVGPEGIVGACKFSMLGSISTSEQKSGKKRSRGV